MRSASEPTPRSSEYGVHVTDPSTFVGAAVALGTAALLGTIVPALRAAHVDPLRALRYD